MVKDKKTGQIRFVYKYLEKDGYGLPVDLSQNKFWNKIRLSNEFGKGVYRQKLSDIINTVSCNKEQNIYHDIYESTADISNFSEYEDDDDSVGEKKPEHFFFETVDLLRAIVVAYNQCNDASGEKLAKNTFAEIGLELSKRSYEDVHEDYIALTLLHNDYVKNAMFTHFHGELKKRLRAVWQYTVNQPAVYAAANMMNTLQHLDALLVDLADVHGNNRPETEDKAASDNKSHKYARTNSLNTLYFDLKSTRNANSNNSINVKPGHYIFELPDSPENRQLIQDIELILHNGQQFDADTKKQKFEMLYRRYLYERNKESGNAADGDAFFRHYLLIGDYIYGTPNLDEFEEEVRQELYEFAKKTFDAVSQSDFLPYSVANIEFKYSRSAFAYSRLKNAHDQIRYKIHSALRLLSSANTLMFFFAPWEISLASGNQEEKTLSLPDSFAQKLEALTKAMNCQRTRFHKEYPHIGLLYDNSPESLRFFADSYNVRCPAVYGSDPLCYTELSAFYEKFSNSGNPFNMMLWEEASLRYEAQMIVLDEIDQTVLLLRKEFEFYPSV